MFVKSSRCKEFPVTWAPPAVVMFAGLQSHLHSLERYIYRKPENYASWNLEDTYSFGERTAAMALSRILDGVLGPWTKAMYHFNMVFFASYSCEPGQNCRATASCWSVTGSTTTGRGRCNCRSDDGFTILPLVFSNITMENHPFQWANPP